MPGKSGAVSPLDLREHLLRIGGGERVLGGFADGFQFCFGFLRWLTRARSPQRAADPFGHGDTLPASQTPDFFHLRIRNQDMEPRAHSKSMAHSSTAQERFLVQASCR